MGDWALPVVRAKQGCRFVAAHRWAGERDVGAASGGKTDEWCWRMQIIPCYWSGSSVSVRRSAEVGLSRNKVTDARREPPGDCLDVMRQTIITVGDMEAGHGQEMFE